MLNAFSYGGELDMNPHTNTLLAALTPCLNGMAFYSTIGAVYATISLPWLQYCFTVFALVEERTSILWHGFFLGEATFRAGDIGF